MHCRGRFVGPLEGHREGETTDAPAGVDHRTDLVDGRHHIREAPPFVVRETRTAGGQPIKKALELFLQGYVPRCSMTQASAARYRILEVARKW